MGVGWGAYIKLPLKLLQIAKRLPHTLILQDRLILPQQPRARCSVLLLSNDVLDERLLDVIQRDDYGEDFREGLVEFPLLGGRRQFDFFVEGDGAAKGWVWGVAVGGGGVGGVVGGRAGHCCSEVASYGGRGSGTLRGGHVAWGTWQWWGLRRGFLLELRSMIPRTPTPYGYVKKRLLRE